jgi:hypothetical protein
MGKKSKENTAPLRFNSPDSRSNETYTFKKSKAKALIKAAKANSEVWSIFEFIEKGITHA